MKKIISALMMLVAIGASAQESVGLKDAYKDKFYIGGAMNTWQIDQRIHSALGAVEKHFNSIVAENCMKCEELQPVEGQFQFKWADQFVDYGEANNMFIVGHCLVWHSQCPAWMFQGKWRVPMTKELLIKRMRDHIHTVVGRYKGRVHGWDVVNEAINDDGTFRKSPYYNIIGEEFIELAFKFAHEADPDAELYYNDYSMDKPAKREAVVRLVKNLKAKGCRIDAVGMQSHVAFDTPLDEYEKSIEAFAAAGVKVQVTELDLSVLPWPQQGMGAAVETNYAYRKQIDPYKDGLPKDMAKKQGDFFCKLFAIYLKHADVMKRVTFWGVLDSESWKNNWPVEGRTDYPLAFDANGNAKPFVKQLIELAKTTK
ncbi:MAG: endo-1,4-beta-xylanase [Prevotella sp.]|nr:endo-1,4-beta-xylanase [Candidatus Prevotella equi]